MNNAYNPKKEKGLIEDMAKMIQVNIKLEFADRRQLQRMIDFTWKLKCPLEDAKCIGCVYHESCLKLRDICRRLEIADFDESKHSS